MQKCLFVVLWEKGLIYEVLQTHFFFIKKSRKRRSRLRKLINFLLSFVACLDHIWNGRRLRDFAARWGQTLEVNNIISLESRVIDNSLICLRKIYGAKIKNVSKNGLKLEKFRSGKVGILIKEYAITLFREDALRLLQEYIFILLEILAINLHREDLVKSLHREMHFLKLQWTQK